MAGVKDYNIDIKTFRKNIKAWDFWNSLGDLIHSDDEKAFNSLLKAGLDINEKLFSDDTPLILAASPGKTSLKMARFLIDSGADVNAENESGRTALLGSVHNKNEEGDAILELLIENGADINHHEKLEGETIMSSACAFRDVKFMKYLLDHGSDIYDTDIYGNGYLHKAAFFGFTNKAELLLKNGININHLNNEDANCLMVSCEKQSALLPMADLFLSFGLNFNHRDNNGWTAAVYQAYYGHGENCVKLLEHPKAEKPDQFILDAIMLLNAEHGGLESFIWAFERGGNVNQTAVTGDTLRELAGKCRNKDIVKFLDGKVIK